MVSRLITLFILLFFTTSCLNHRTEYGKKRFRVDPFKMKQNNSDSIYKIIDTSKLYEKVLIFDIKRNNNLTVFKKIYLKFYKNGKVGTFYFFDKNDKNSINPEKADIGYYNFSKKGLFIQTFFEHPQGGGYVKDKFNKISGDTIYFGNDEYLSKYQAVSLPNSFLIYKPDW